jgi:hypothetical protein
MNLLLRLTSSKLNYKKTVNSQQRRLPTDDTQRTTSGKAYHRLKILLHIIHKLGFTFFFSSQTLGPKSNSVHD